MTQADLFTDAPTPRQKKRGHVPRTSVQSYLGTDTRSRASYVVSFLHMTDWRGYPTSAELARTMFERVNTDSLLYVRRGLSDALSQGLVEHAGERTCQVSGRKCVVWRTVAR